MEKVLSYTMLVLYTKYNTSNHSVAINTVYTLFVLCLLLPVILYSGHGTKCNPKFAPRNEDHILGCIK